MNSLRIALIGAMVDLWGSGMAEGLLHQVQGWMMFMLSTFLLVLEVIGLARLGGERRPWREVFGLQAPEPLPAGGLWRKRAISAPLLVAGAAVLLFNVAAFAMPAQTQRVPARESFATFPLRIGSWSGQREVMDQVYLNALKLDDYLLADYVAGGASPVNLYVAWYDTQRAGEATHSPKACLPGGGWRIQSLSQIRLAPIKMGTQPLRVNRALIQYGDQRQLVYYWFQQRGRVITNEYLVKWYLLVDALRRHRTDGALVRLIVPIPTSMTSGDADRELRAFAAVIAPRLGRYLPN
jgi:exosortase D (VPLPA-CTERM-specific)